MWPALRALGGFYRRTFLRRTRIVAVVGSFGKTTTTKAVATVLGVPEHPMVGGNASSSVPVTLLHIGPGRRHWVMEIGIDGPGQMARHAWTVRPDVVVATSIGSEHNRSLGTLEATRAEKLEMVKALSSFGTAVLNGDDPHVRWMAERAPGRVITFGFGPENDVRATDVAIDWPCGTRFNLHVQGATHSVRMRLIGWPPVYAILAAVAVALAEGQSVPGVLPALEALGPTPNRLEPFLLPSRATVLDDTYKGTYETFDAALDVLAQISAQRKIALIGQVDEAPGPSGPVYRHIGERVGRLCSRVLFLGTSKNLRALRSGARRAGLADHHLLYAGRDVLKAVRAVRDCLDAGDVLLVKGRYSQRLMRVVLALTGKQVRCNLDECHARHMGCTRCPMLTKGWTVPNPVI